MKELGKPHLFFMIHCGHTAVQQLGLPWRFYEMYGHIKASIGLFLMPMVDGTLFANKYDKTIKTVLIINKKS